jgi:hypothetical protein
MHHPPDDERHVRTQRDSSQRQHASERDRALFVPDSPTVVANSTITAAAMPILPNA